MISGAQSKQLLQQDKDGNLSIDTDFVDVFYKETEKNWKLVRERDGLTKFSRAVIWVDWNEDGTFKEQFKEIGKGRSLVMSPFNDYYAWMTTELTEILESDEMYVKFKTANSIYSLFKIDEQ
tara:strand:- start:317 stop:682 length:366 start_codon:yes stop_codon:yes gene_type:complete